MYGYEYSDGQYIYSVVQLHTQTEDEHYAPISAERYAAIKEAIMQKPAAESGYGHRLRTDLTWEQFVLPVVPETPTVEDKAEAFDILTGVES
jgi:hypothetical protein